MLSYRHAFHAGNHADVLKHIVLVQLLEYLNQKDKPYLYVDTAPGKRSPAVLAPRKTGNAITFSTKSR